MAKVKYTAVINENFKPIWAVLKPFGQISKWHSAIAESFIEGDGPEGVVGSIRRLFLSDGGVMREKLLSVDDSNLLFSYRFEDSPLPVDNYVATVRLLPLTGEDKTVIHWSASFDNREPDSQGVQAAKIQSLIVGGHESLKFYLKNVAKNTSR